MRRRASSLREPGVAQGRHEEVGNSLSGGPGAGENDALVAHRLAGHPEGGVHAGGRDGGRALNVVVERAQSIAKARELGQRVGLQEVFPLQNGIGVHAHHGVHEPIDELLILASTNPLVSQAEVQRVVQAVLVVGADVEHDRQRQIRGNAGAGGVERQLPDRDSHSADALVAQPEDALPVGDDDHGRRPRMVPEDGLDLIALVERDIEAARVTVDVGVLLARFADDRRVHDRHHLVDVILDKAEEQCFVPILQAGEEGVSLERGLSDAVVLVDAGELLVDGADGGRHQAVEAKLLALGRRERRALVRERIAEQRFAARIDLDVLVARDAVVLDRPLHVPFIVAAEMNALGRSGEPISRFARPPGKIRAMDLLQFVRGCTFDDFLLTPQLGVVPSRDPAAIDLTTPFSEHLTLNRPIVSANMDTVTRAAMAVVLAEEGGIGVIDRGFRAGDIAPQVRRGRAVKRTQHGVIADPAHHRRRSPRLRGGPPHEATPASARSWSSTSSAGSTGLLTERDVRFVGATGARGRPDDAARPAGRPHAARSRSPTPSR